MNIKEFSNYLQKLDETSKRLDITDILADLITSLDVQETAIGVYLACGYLKPKYRDKTFNIADRMIIRVLGQSFKTPLDKVNKLYQEQGDLGNVAKILAEIQVSKENLEKLTVAEVYSKLEEIALIEGGGSQERKIIYTSDLFSKLDAVSIKYVLRMILGTTRLGFTELTIIDALSKIVSDDKSMSKNIEKKYNIHPDIGFVAETVKKYGAKGIEKISMETGIPILSQKAQRLSEPNEIMQKVEGLAWIEYKFDGMRVQLHMDKKKAGFEQSANQQDLFALSQTSGLIKTFTRNLEENTHQFPDIVVAAISNIHADSVILDGEAIGYDPQTQDFLPFQEIMQRKRKHNVESMSKQVPLKYFVFDILYLNGQDVSQKPLKERNKLLSKIISNNNVIEMAEHFTTHDALTLWDHFETSKIKNLEGIMIKNPNSPYRAGAREFSWIKLKRSNTELIEDTLDCVILGYYYGRGNRAGFGVGGFLAGVWDNQSQSFKTFTKVGTGLKDEEWLYLKEQCDQLALMEKPVNFDIEKTLEPDVFVSPKLLVELAGDEISVSANHTAGYALRFPRLMKFRHDKAPTDTTNLEEIKTLYESQRK